MKIGLCSLWHGAPELLPEFVRLAVTGKPDQVIIVDNASPDPAPYTVAAQQIAAAGIQAGVLTMKSNDVLRGWNAGMNALDTDIRVCMANDLLMVRPEWLDEITRWCMPGMMVGPFVKLFGEQRVRYLDGSIFAIHKLDWKRLGGFDEGYEHPGYVSDVDLCYRAEELGIQLKQMAPFVLHLERYTAGPAEKNREGWLRNVARFQAKANGHAG